MIINLTEYKPEFFAADAFPYALGELLWQSYGDKFQVDFPSPKTANQWKLTSMGWVGHIPLKKDFEIHIHPKLPLQNLFNMWAYAYQLKSFHLLDGLVNVGSLVAFYDQLACILAQRVLTRTRQGLYLAYQARNGRLAFLRGQLDLQQVWQRPLQPTLPCRYDIHTADTPDNQILAYTLSQIARSHRCRPAVQASIRRAYRALAGAVTPHEFQADDCYGRTYTRLNQDYQPLHALCRFFIAHTGPQQANGQQKMLPFLVDMARLYEQFVAAWLQTYLPNPWRIRAQERINIGQQHNGLQFDIDLVLYGRDERPYAVLDTKYKTPTRPSNNDINQIIAYAKAKGCREAVLVYPVALERPLNVTLDGLRLRSLTFGLEANLELAGHQFLVDLGTAVAEM